jgi:hypothetical protein
MARRPLSCHSPIANHHSPLNAETVSRAAVRQTPARSSTVPCDCFAKNAVKARLAFNLNAAPARSRISLSANVAIASRCASVQGDADSALVHAQITMHATREDAGETAFMPTPICETTRTAIFATPIAAFFSGAQPDARGTAQQVGYSPSSAAPLAYLMPRGVAYSPRRECAGISDRLNLRQGERS